MFSANENLMLRQHKRRIVEQIEATIPEDALDIGTTVMVMQVSCKAPGCVPLETAIIIVFPNSTEELIPGLPESQNGGSYKTKILKPMADVTQDDVLEALPPAFEGGTRTMEKLCIAARDIMLAQITQLFGEEQDSTVPDRKAMAEYLQGCLQDYIERNCKPPELGEAFPALEEKVKEQASTKTHPASSETSTTTPSATTVSSSTASQGNLVIRRDLKEATTTGSTKATIAPPSSTPTTVLSARSGPPKHERAIQQALNPFQSNNISKLFEREHAPGIRQPGCPCCDPDNPSTIVDNLMML
jgi:hypothetical protein